MHIEIYGTLGSGKSTLAQAFAKATGFNYAPEPVDNHPFLQDFYNDPVKYGFENALFFASAYSHVIKQSANKDIILDNGYSLHKAYIDIQQYSEQARSTLAAIFNTIAAETPKPDVIIHLDYPTDLIMGRIKQRGRSFESGITPEFIDALQTSLRRNIAADSAARNIPVITLKPDDIDVVKNPGDILKLRAAIKAVTRPRVL